MPLISVSEYAAKYDKDPGNIRRLLAEGRIKGQKIGSQWVLDEDAKYPSDERIVSGNYRNARKRIYFNTNKKLSNSVHRMIYELRSIYGNRLEKAVLYGSYARGEATNESDVDIALFIDGDSNSNLSDKMFACVAKYELECGKVLSVIDINKTRFTEWADSLPFYRNIDKEGIVLWTRS